MAENTSGQMAEGDVVHACPPRDSGLTPCCGKTPFEMPRRDRMASDPALVNCMTGGDPRLTPRDLPVHRTEAGYPNCSTCDGGGCLDCTDPA